MGAPDAQGVYIYTEDDLAAPDAGSGGGFSKMLNKAPESISAQLEAIRADVDEGLGGVSSRRFPVPFSHAGALVVKQGAPFRNKSGRDLTVDVVHVHLDDASTAGAVLCDLEVGGVSLLAAQISLGVGVHDVDVTPTTTLWADGADLSFDVDAAGTGAAGLTVGVWVH